VQPDDEWAPLPPETVPLAGDPAPPPAPRGSIPTPALRPRAADAPAAAAPTEAEREAAERAFQELKQRLQAAPTPKQNPVRRAFAHATRKAAATATFGGKPSRAAAPVAPADDHTPGTAGVQYSIDRDPREDEPWFAQLPPDEQQRLRAQWHTQRHRFDNLGAIWWRDVRRATWQGAFVFFVLAVLQAPMRGTFGPIFQLVLAGALAGAIARMLGGGRFVFAGAGAAAHLLIMAPTLGLGLLSPLGLITILIASSGLGLLGYDREMKRSGGFSPRE
jgi:hypothetical protein